MHIYCVLITGGFWGTCKGILLWLIMVCFSISNLQSSLVLDSGYLASHSQFAASGGWGHWEPLQQFHREPVTSCFKNLAQKLYEIVKCVYTKLGKLLDQMLVKVVAWVSVNSLGIEEVFRWNNNWVWPFQPGVEYHLGTFLVSWLISVKVKY